jgi:hypothetical protein
MDDDIKNLFQKFGKSGDAYKEINREEVSEQAKQRWPLLRDVHISAVPVYPLKSDKADGVLKSGGTAEISRPIAASQPRAEPVVAVSAPAVQIFPSRSVAETMPETKVVAATESPLLSRHLASRDADAIPAKPGDVEGETLNAVFARLLGPREEIRPVDASPNSFFKKLFKP